MNPKIKSYLAVVAGILTGAVVIAVVEMLSPNNAPANLNVEDKAQMTEYMRTLPMSAYAIVLLGYFFGALLGGIVANRICRGTPYRPAMVVAVGLCIAGAMNFFMFPHPVWFIITSSLIYFVGAWLANKVSDKF